MIDCHIIFNEPTDREDWLDRCVASLEHPDIAVHVHRFAESAPVNPRREAIMRVHTGDNWFMFADPDDYAYPPALRDYVEFLCGVEGDLAWGAEIQRVLSSGALRYIAMPHHLVAIRRTMVLECVPSGLPPYHYTRDTRLFFPYPVYNWVMHGHNTAGGTREH
jgi:hypothetical protein